MADLTPDGLPIFTSPPTLHHLCRSQSLRVLWALEELSALGKPYNLINYARAEGRSPETLRQLTTLGKSPVLTFDAGPDGKAATPTLLESRLCLQNLGDVYADGAWTPDTPADKFRDRYWAEFSGATLGSTMMLLLVLDIMPGLTPFLVRPLVSLVSKGAVSQLKKELDKPYQVMEEALSGGQEWFGGGKLGVSDFCMSWPMDVAIQRGYIDVKKFPKIVEWVQRVHERPAYKAALEKGGNYELDKM